MKFSTREDIEAPIDHVFARMSDFAAFERLIVRRGGEVARTEDRTPPAAGMAWDTAFDLRGKRRQMAIELTRFQPPSELCMAATSRTLTGELELDLTALSRARTRIRLSLDLKPLNLSGRLMLQSLKLARGNISRRFEMRVASHAREIEDGYLRRA